MKLMLYHILFLLIFTLSSVSLANDKSTGGESIDKVKEAAGEAYEASKKAAGATYDAGKEVAHDAAAATEKAVHHVADKSTELAHDAAETSEQAWDATKAAAHKTKSLTMLLKPAGRHGMPLKMPRARLLNTPVRKCKRLEVLCRSQVARCRINQRSSNHNQETQ